MLPELNLRNRLHLELPVIQAPMAGGGDTPDLVAAVCNAGALGSVGAAYLTPQQIAQTGRVVRAKTSRAFGINLFAPSATPVDFDLSPDAALHRLAPYFAELGVPLPGKPAKLGYSFEEQLHAALDTGAGVFSFTFGSLPADTITTIKARGALVMGTATTVDEAVALEQLGVDAVVAQGSEAGGHRGSFRADFADAMIGTIALVPQIVDAVRIPVVASGGIMDGRGVVAALTLGASAAQLGTAFLTCSEAGVANAYKEAIFAAREDQTRITRAFSGRPARGIANRFLREMESADSANAILPFPLQNALTRPLRSEAAKVGRAEFLSLWAGQGLRMARRETAAQLVARLAREIDESAQNLRRRLERNMPAR
jgi:nitronate monooxygenase